MARDAEHKLHEQRMLDAAEGLQYNCVPLPFQAFKLFSLADMFRFLPSTAYLVSGRLTSLQYDLMKDRLPAGLALYSTPSAERLKHWKITLDKLRPLAEKMGMSRTLERLGRIDSKIHQWNNTTLLDVSRELDFAVMSDFADYRFFYIPKGTADYYEQADLFEVADQFPSANVEIRCAGNCYATGNYTAAVFHLMRAVEICTRIMVREMGADKYLIHSGIPIPVELCDWDKLIQGMNKALLDLEKGKGADPVIRKTYNFYSTAKGTFTYFKDAWRNILSHTNTIGDTDRTLYLQGETEEIMRETRRYVQHLATRLSE